MRSFLFCCLLSTLLALPARAQEEAPAQDQVPTGKITLAYDIGRHSAPVERVFFRDEDRQLVTAATDGTVRIWDLVTGETVKVIYPPGTPDARSAVMSADGKRLAIASRHADKGKVANTFHLLSLPDGRLLRTERRIDTEGKQVLTQTFAFSPDGTRLATGSSGTADAKNLRIWDLEKEGAKPHVLVFEHFRASQASLAFSPDGKRLAWVALDKGGILNLESDKQEKGTAIERGNQIVWSPDGKTIATRTWPDFVRLYDPQGKLLRTDRPGGGVSHILFSADSKTLLVHRDLNPYHRAILLDVATGKEHLTVNPSKKGAQPKGGALSRDGKLAATVGGMYTGDVFVWQTSDGKMLHEILSAPWMFGGAAFEKPAWRKDGKAVCWLSYQRRDSSLKNLLTGHATFDLEKLEFLPTLDKDQRDEQSLKEDGVMEKDGLTLKRLKPGLAQVHEKGKPIRSLGVPAASLLGNNLVALALYPDRVYALNVVTGAAGRLSPDHRFLMQTNVQKQTLSILNSQQEQPLLTLYRKGHDWIIWTEAGYYAATPGGERLMGWKVDNGIDKMPSFYTVDRFRKQLHRPDVIRLAFEKGSIAEALKAADAARGTKTRTVKVEDLLPPRVVLTVDDSEKPTYKLKVQAEASAKDQPITSLRLKLDGKIVPGDATRAEFPGGKAKADVVWTIDLPEGEHQLNVMARSPDSIGYSPAIRLKFVNAKNLPVLHVLAIGINNYKDGSLDLKYAAPDAKALAAAFEKHCKGQPFRDVKTATLLNQQATTKQIEKALLDMRKNAQPQDLVVVFFACHGVVHKTEYYLLTHEANTNMLDSTCLSGTSLRKSLSEYKCQVLLMLDACQSAGFGAGKKLSRLGLKPAADDVARDLTDDDCGVAVWCAAMAHEKAVEQGGNGLFTRAVLEALEKRPGVPFNKHNERLYIHHLHSYVFDEVSVRSDHRQHPFLRLPSIVESFVVR